MDIEVKQLSVTFPSPMGAVRVLRDVNLLFHGGKITALVGESGSGKSILGTAIMRLLPENARMTGSIFYDGNDLPLLSEKEMNEIRGDRIGWIAQDPISAMDPLMRVGRQMTEVLRKRLGWGKEKRRESALGQLEKYGLGDPVRVCASYPHQLSGGMAQRVMAAMMTLPSPEWLIADEPTKGLGSACKKTGGRYVPSDQDGRKGDAAHHSRPRTGRMSRRSCGGALRRGSPRAGEHRGYFQESIPPLYAGTSRRGAFSRPSSHLRKSTGSFPSHRRLHFSESMCILRKRL